MINEHSRFFCQTKSFFCQTQIMLNISERSVTHLFQESGRRGLPCYVANNVERACGVYFNFKSLRLLINVNSDR